MRLCIFTITSILPCCVLFGMPFLHLFSFFLYILVQLKPYITKALNSNSLYKTDPINAIKEARTSELLKLEHLYNTQGQQHKSVNIEVHYWDAL